MNKKECCNQSRPFERQTICSSSKSHLLPTEIVFVILDKLLEPIDQAKFSRVCKEWHSLAKLYNRERQPWRTLTHPRPPMLYLPMAPFHDRDRPCARLYSLLEERIYNEVELVALGKSRVYCGYGWVAKLKFHYDHGTVSITLVHHFGKPRETIRLPFLMLSNLTNHVDDDFRCNLSADPILDKDNYVVIAKHNHHDMYFIKRNQDCWKRIYLRMRSLNPHVIYYKGQVYVIHAGALSSVVESTKGDLLLVERIMESSWTKGFKVYKLEELRIDGSFSSQEEVNNIGDEVLFVGENQALSVSASNFPKCRPNCIYYTRSRYSTDLYGDDIYDDDVGIFNLKDGSITKLCPNYISEGLKSPAVWITSSFPVG